MAAGGTTPGKPAWAQGPDLGKPAPDERCESREGEGEAKAAARFETPRAQLPGGLPPARGLSRRLKCAHVRQTAAVTASEVIGLARARTSCAQTQADGFPLPSPSARPHFIPSLLRSVFNSARRYDRGGGGRALPARAAPGPHPAGIRAAPGARLLSSGRKLSRGGRGSSVSGPRLGSTRFPRRGGRSPAGGPAPGTERESAAQRKLSGFQAEGQTGGRGLSRARASPFEFPRREGGWFSIWG